MKEILQKRNSYVKNFLRKFNFSQVCNSNRRWGVWRGDLNLFKISWVCIQHSEIQLLFPLELRASLFPKGLNPFCAVLGGMDQKIEISFHSWAPISWLVRIISKPLPLPTKRGNRWVPPSQGMSPFWMWGNPKCDASVEILRSQANASSKPCPMASPSIAAITGRSSLATGSAIERRSDPASNSSEIGEKASPSPWRTTVRISRFERISPQRSVNSSERSLMASPLTKKFAVLHFQEYHRHLKKVNGVDAVFLQEQCSIYHLREMITIWRLPIVGWDSRNDFRGS